MNKQINLYTKVESFDNHHLAVGQINFGIMTIPYSAKMNRGMITQFILLNEEKINLNEQIPQVMMQKIKKGILGATRSLLEKRNRPEKITIPKAEEGTLTWWLHQNAEKITGSMMVTFEMDEKEFYHLFEKASDEDEMNPQRYSKLQKAEM